ncbi:MAG: hypothetical protein IIZ75_08550 [Lachnospiraceae bacterium]|nr:hypothetical protein [Lachnospiraceae bacterium]
MKIFKDIRQKYGHLYEWYYILVIAGYTLTLISLKVRPGVIAGVLLCLVTLELIADRCVSTKSFIDKLILFYIGYNILSVIWLHASGMPFSVFIGEFTVSIFPVVFYFAGKSVGERLPFFYEKFTLAVVFAGVLGIILYITAPQFYIDYSYDLLFISKADAATMRVRMNSVVGCTLLGFLGTAGMMTGAFFLGDGGKKEKRETRGCLKAVIYIAVCMVTAVMSNQRSSLVTVILVLVFINYLIFFKLELLNKKYFYIEAGGLVLVLILLCVIKPELLLKIWWRLESLPGAVSERSEQWVAAVNNMYSTWIGNGLGANGHRALGIEDAHVIADGGLVKLYCEEGVIGFSVFLFIVLNAVKKGLGDIKDFYVELGLIAVTLLQSIGSNVIAFQLAAPIFWFAIGRINLAEADGKIPDNP